MLLEKSFTVTCRCSHTTNNNNASTIITYFFFYSSGHHRDLHSFPTRRSSDLSGNPRFIGSATAPVNIDQWTIDINHTVSDRKSTRLNSSHRCISYAVFCLKKKKNQKKQKVHRK